MITFIEFNGKKLSANLRLPLDISIPLRSGSNNPNAFGIQEPLFEPFRSGDFIASVALGSPVNCENLFLNPHGNGTHTECVGHIMKEKITVNQSLQSFFFIAQLISAPLTSEGINSFVSAGDIIPEIETGIEALLIRTLPNNKKKLAEMYSANHPAYLSPQLCSQLFEKNIQHLLVDLPSVDPEKDDGALAAHKAFWNVPLSPRKNVTITEMIFVPDEIPDGLYLLNLQIASIESDASPSKPVLYALG